MDRKVIFSRESKQRMRRSEISAYKEKRRRDKKVGNKGRDQ
jgi:hypothetical protein